MRGRAKASGDRVESVAVPSDGGAEGCRSCFGREFQSSLQEHGVSYFEGLV